MNPQARTALIVGGIAATGAGAWYYLKNHPITIPASQQGAPVPTGSGSGSTGGTGGTGGSTGGGSTVSVPSPVSGITVRITGPTTGLLTWNAVSGATRYLLQHTDASGNPSSIPIQMNGADASRISLGGTAAALAGSPASTAHFTVAACNAAGCSRPSRVVAVAFPYTGPAGGSSSGGSSGSGGGPSCTTQTFSIADASQSLTCVKHLQYDLNLLIGSDLAVDGYFGRKTQAAVVSFQQQQNLVETGKADPATWQAIERVAFASGPHAAQSVQL